MSSVAMIMASNFFARRQRSQTCRRSGLFAMRCSGFPGKRVDCQRAGIIPTALFICCLQDDFGASREIFGDPVGAAAVGHFVKAGPNADRLDAGDRKSTRLNSSHVEISYAVFCLKKK